MKARTSVILILMYFIASSCSDAVCGLDSDAPMADVHFSCGEPSVRSDINRLSVLAFTEDGVLANSTVGTGSSIVMRVPQKVLHCYAVVNAHTAVENVLTEKSLLSKVSYLSGNSFEEFEMLGTTTVDITKQKTVNITVERFAALIRLENITLNWKDQYRYPDIRVTRIFAENVVPSCLYSFGIGNIPANTWINKMMWESNLGGLVGSEESLTLSNGSSVSCNKALIIYPNPTMEDTQGKTPFSARHTRLVIEVLCGDTRWYYPVTIPSVKPNTCYCLENLIITGPGSVNSDIEVSRSNLSIDLTICSWGANYSFEESM